ncbi:Rossmann-like and DUF2520 domain-containing protein [Flagellimonas myxillae]|uniref:Rossmann-like and DUF2520 domain-containing protein n=1 Tax=Flagellimonas myxillae TaxID=2942214 RepID=UPI00201FB2D2|nr:Rossmann-like and DUF2520 domain-containing protein [Muricauda myxillae]MCL6266164.1 DUF2520 domain-containing protein [Muricauda myxillae]
MLSVVILGTGNLAQHLAEAFSGVDPVSLVQVFGRDPVQLQWFENHAPTCSKPDDIVEADAYIVAVSDTSILEVSQLLSDKNGVVAHTSGAATMDVLPMANRGVFYPVQTFTKGKSVDFHPIPICIEANLDSGRIILNSLAKSISSKVHPMDSKQRRQLHLAAVFANNFTNHLYGISEEICNRNQIPFDLLMPLIEETAAKIKSLSPTEAQTGPSKRGDQKSMDQHLSLITNNREKEIYTFLSDAIKSKYEKKL